MHPPFLLVFSMVFLHLQLQTRLLQARTYDDTLRDMRGGDGQVLLGAYLCEVDIIRKGLSGSGKVWAHMNQFMGEEVLDLGRLFYDFPIAPAVHVSVFRGGKTGAEATFFFMVKGANVNDFKLETNDSLILDSYPPAMLFALGLGQPPRSSHAALLERVHESLERHIPTRNFNITVASHWLWLTASPPIIHVPILAKFFDGVYVLWKEFHADLNAQDVKNLTALHLAAWDGDLNLCKFLIFNQANMFHLDYYNRTPLHFAVMRGHNQIIADLLYPTFNHTNLTMAESHTHRELLLGEKLLVICIMSLRISHLTLPYAAIIRIVEQYTGSLDKDRLSPLALASLHPPLHLTMQYLQFEIDKLQSSLQSESIQETNPLYKPIMQRRLKVHLTEQKTPLSLSSALPERQLDEVSSTHRGGWDYGPVLNQPSSKADQRLPLICPSISRTSSSSSNSDSDITTSNKPSLVFDSSIDNDNTETIRCSSIDIINANALKKGTFRRDYFSRQRPVLITGGLTAGQGIWGYWQKLEFLNRYGSTNVTFGERYHTGNGTWMEREKNYYLPPLETISLEAYVGMYLGKTGVPVCSNEEASQGTCGMTQPAVPFSTPWVAINERADDPAQSQQHRRSWSLDIHRPSIFNLCTPSERDDEPLKLYVGGRGSGVPLHSHAASWNLLITGVKRWFFVAPGHARDGTLDGSKSDPSNPEAQHQSEHTTARWLKEVAPDLLRRGVISEVVQYPGDVIFVPHDWMHATFNEADSVAVAQEFCTLRHTNLRFNPLGYIVYGGNDFFRGLGRPNTYIPGNDQVKKVNMNQMSNTQTFPGVLQL